jgi:hypothetical protein
MCDCEGGGGDGGGDGGSGGGSGGGVSVGIKESIPSMSGPMRSINMIAIIGHAYMHVYLVIINLPWSLSSKSSVE